MTPSDPAAKSASFRLESSAGVELAVHAYGNPAGRPLLVGHATGFHGRVYEPLFAADGPFSVTAPDLRAHGDSTPPADRTFHWDGFADDLCAVLDDLDPSLLPILAFGHSMGAAALLRVEIRRPGSFAGIYGYEPIVYPWRQVPVQRQRRGNLIEATRRRRRRFESLAEAKRNYASKPPLDRLDAACLDAYVRYGFRQLPDGAVELKMDPEHEAGVFSMSVHHDTFERLGEVGCPVVVARGAIAGRGPSEWAEEIAGKLPAGRLEPHEELLHLGPLEAPARFAALVAAVTPQSGDG